jgi:hypothetical protein
MISKEEAEKLAEEINGKIATYSERGIEFPIQIKKAWVSLERDSNGKPYYLLRYQSESLATGFRGRLGSLRGPEKGTISTYSINLDYLSLTRDKTGEPVRFSGMYGHTIYLKARHYD